MHTDDDYKEKNSEEEDYSDFYNVDNTEEEKNNKEKKEGNKNKKVIIIIIALALILIALIIVLIFVLKKEKPIDFNLSLNNINGDAWSKENVVINVDVPDETNLKSIKYTINCNKDCEYVEVNDKKIEISNNGKSEVTVVVTNIDNVENRKNITAKIDNNNPTLTLSPDQTNITSKDPVTVCAMCVDNESGCKEEKVCKDYAKTSKSQTLTVEDNAGNKTTSKAFNITISGTTVPAANPSCTLSVNKTGLVTATNKNVNGYHGFSSKYSGNNENSKQLSLSEGKVEKVTYYVKNTDGKTSSCSISVSASECCKYRANNGECYKTLVKEIMDPKSKECANAHRTTNDRCYIFADKGVSCTYTKVS